MKPTEPFNLSGLEELHLPGTTDGTEGIDPQDARLALWEAGEFPPAEDVAFSLQQIFAVSSEGLEVQDQILTEIKRGADASERIAVALEALVQHAATAAAALGA